MRILISTDCVGGVWDFTVSLANRLCGSHQEVMVAVLGEPTAAQLARLSRDAVVESRHVRLEWMHGSESDLEGAAQWLRGLSETWNADIVHLNQLVYTGFTFFRAPTIVVVHSDVRSWFGEVRATSPPPEWNSYCRWVRQGLATASVVVTPSSFQGELTRRHYGRGPDRVIHNGAEPTPDPPHSRAPILLSAGRAWDQAKGMEILDEAMHLLGRAAPEAHHFGSLVSPDGNIFYARRVRCHGQTDPGALHHWMARASVYVAPARYEPFGLAPLEAAFRGCALVLSDIPTFREIWDGSAEFFVVGDPAALAVSIRRVFADPDFASTLATRARAHAEERYTEDRMARDYLDLYRKAVKGSVAERPISIPHPQLVGQSLAGGDPQ